MYVGKKNKVNWMKLPHTSVHGCRSYAQICHLEVINIFVLYKNCYQHLYKYIYIFWLIIETTRNTTETY